MTVIADVGYFLYHPMWESFIQFEQTHDGRGSDLQWNPVNDSAKFERVNEETFGYIYYKAAAIADRQWIDNMILVPFFDSSKTGVDVDFFNAITVPEFVRDYVPEKCKQ